MNLSVRGSAVHLKTNRINTVNAAPT